MLAAHGLVDLALHIVAQQRCKGTFFGVIGFGSSLHGEESLLVEVLQREAVFIGNGLVLAVPLPEPAVQQALIDLPQLAQRRAVSGSGQSGKRCVCVLLAGGLCWLLFHRLFLPCVLDQIVVAFWPLCRLGWPFRGSIRRCRLIQRCTSGCDILKPVIQNG